MSADNQISILVTAGPQYRVSHVVGLDFFINADLDDPLTQAIFVMQFSETEYFVNREDAIEYAFKLEDNVGYTEYGVGFLNYEQYEYESFMSREFAERLLQRESCAVSTRRSKPSDWDGNI